MENSLDQRLDGLQSEMDKKIDNLHYSISRVAQQRDHQREENPEDECLIEIILGEQVQLQPQEELKVESVEAPEELQDAPESGVTFWPWKKEEQISALITEESSGIEAGKEPQKLTLQPNPIDCDPNATAQLKNNPLPVAPSFDQVYTLPAAQRIPKAPTKKATPSLPMLKNFKRLVAIVQNFATT